MNICVALCFIIVLSLSTQFVVGNADDDVEIEYKDTCTVIDLYCRCDCVSKTTGQKYDDNYHCVSWSSNRGRWDHCSWRKESRSISHGMACPWQVFGTYNGNLDCDLNPACSPTDNRGEMCRTFRLNKRELKNAVAPERTSFNSRPEWLESWNAFVKNTHVSWCRSWHARDVGINMDDVAVCGCNVQAMDSRSDLWKVDPGCSDESHSANATTWFKLQATITSISGHGQCAAHPGASICYRQLNSEPANQCCYDSTGQLITDYRQGAGSADKATGFYQHYKQDVVPYDMCKKADLVNLYFERRPAESRPCVTQW